MLFHGRLFTAGDYTEGYPIGGNPIEGNPIGSHLTGGYPIRGWPVGTAQVVHHIDVVAAERTPEPKVVSTSVLRKSRQSMCGSQA